MQQVADFITAVLYMFWASCAHHQEYKKNTDEAATGTGRTTSTGGCRISIFSYS